MKVIRKYLLEGNELESLLGGEHIYLVEKPEKVNPDVYIIYKYKIVSSGYIKGYLVEFNIIGKDLNRLISIQDKLIEMLDDLRNEKSIKDDETVIRQSKLLNGGGMVKNPETGNYELIVFFLCKV